MENRNDLQRQVPMQGQPTPQQGAQPPMARPMPPQGRPMPPRGAQPVMTRPIMPPQGSMYGQAPQQPMYGQPPMYGQMPMYGQPPMYAQQPMWNGNVPPAPQNSLIPERKPAAGSAAPAATQETEGSKDYSGEKLELLPRTKRDRSLILTSLIFTLILLLLSVTCLVQFPVEAPDGGYMYVPQNLLQTVTAQLDVILKADTTQKVADTNSAYLKLQQKSGFDVYLGSMNVNFFTLYYAKHDPMANAGSTAAFYLLFAYTVLVPVGLLLTFLRTLFSLFGKRTYATPRALMRMLLPLLFVRIYSLFNLLWSTTIGAGSELEAHLLFPLQAGLDRYNIVVGACALFSLVLVLLARRCENTKPIKIRTTKIILTTVMALIMAVGAMVLPLTQITLPDGSTASFALLDAFLFQFGAALPEGAVATGTNMTTFAAFAEGNAESDIVLFLGQYLPFLACALLAFALTAMVAYVLDSNILLEHGIPDKRYAKKVCNGKTSLWAIILLTIAIGALMVLFNTEIVKYDPSCQFTFQYLYLAPIGGGALFTLILHKFVSAGIKKFRQENRMRKKQFLPS